MRKYLILLLVPFCFYGCKTDQGAIDAGIIKSYISTNHLNAIAEPNGLYYVPTQVGSGAHPTVSDSVVMYYKGYMTNAVTFGATTTTPDTFQLGALITGLQQGIPLMQAGGKATFLIPSALGYGGQTQGIIPANSVLIFDVQLVSFY